MKPPSHIPTTLFIPYNLATIIQKSSLLNFIALSLPLFTKTNSRKHHTRKYPVKTSYPDV